MHVGFVLQILTKLNPQPIAAICSLFSKENGHLGCSLMLITIRTSQLKYTLPSMEHVHILVFQGSWEEGIFLIGGICDRSVPSKVHHMSQGRSTPYIGYGHPTFEKESL